MLGTSLPILKTELPGPLSRAQVDILAQHECPAITARRARRAAALGQADDDPIVWSEACGANVVDVDGNILVDMTAGFGVATLGHRHPDIVAAVERQSTDLLHAMGDAYPDKTRISLLAALAAAMPGDLQQAILGLSGADAIDAAVKTAVIATGKSGVLTFGGGYHGLSLGATGLQAYKPAFAEPFKDILHPNVTHLPFEAPLEDVARVLSSGTVGLVLVEPVQARGGCRAADPEWLRGLSVLTRDMECVLAFDEIYSGFGRTGAPFACTEIDVIPDLVCVGKALGGGFPISACVGTPRVMGTWGASAGEALHTQTFLGHPPACAAGLVTLSRLPQTTLDCQRVSASLREGLSQAGFSLTGRGLIIGVELPDSSLAVSRALFQRGWIALPAGSSGEVLSLTPPSCLTRPLIDAFCTDLVDIVRALR